MPAKRIIPCLDVKEGRVVKGVNFKGLRDIGNVVDLARRYDLESADELVFLDISATNEARRTRLDWVQQAARQLGIPFTVGGGVRDLEDIRTLLRAGADKVAINSAAIANPAFLGEAAEIFGRQCIVVAVDVARDPELGWRVFSHAAKLRTELAGPAWIRRVAELGAGEILLTSIDRDGTLDGFDTDLIQEMAGLPIPVIASGGAGTEAHFLEALRCGADAVLAATLFHEARIPIPRLKTYLAAHGVSIRL